MNFADSLKKWFFNNSSSAASSDARIPLLNADGTPKGSDTMANLASVLGGYPATQVFSDSDFNTFTNYGFYYWGSGSNVPQLNKPTNLNGGSFCLVLRCSVFLIQITMSGYYAGDTGDIFYRVGYDGDNWGSWNVASHIRQLN